MADARPAAIASELAENPGAADPPNLATGPGQPSVIGRPWPGPWVASWPTVSGGERRVSLALLRGGVARICPALRPPAGGLRSVAPSLRR